MKVDGGIELDPRRSARSARQVEAAGFDGAFAGETNHDPFLACLLAAEHTERVDVGTSVAIAFARSPMTTAQAANDLQTISQGRFILGLGSQVQPHIERRFSMPWGRPAARMREYVSAMRAIWRSWHDGAPLSFRGDFYTHTLMTPFFSPGPSPYGPPKVFLAGVGERMTEVAGEVCDGFIRHAFSTERHLREVTIPALERGRRAAGRTLEDFEICGPSFIVTGEDEESFAQAKQGARQQVAFYASTPSYRGVLDLHGWGDLQDELHHMSKQGQWAEMGGLITDDVLDAFAIVAEPERVAQEILRRYGDCVSRITFYTPGAAATDAPRRAIEQLQGTGT